MLLRYSELWRQCVSVVSHIMTSAWAVKKEKKIHSNLPKLKAVNCSCNSKRTIKFQAVIRTGMSTKKDGQKASHCEDSGCTEKQVLSRQVSHHPILLMLCCFTLCEPQADESEED